MDMNIAYYCPNCYREFKTLSHFNRYRSRCTPYLRADGRRRLAVKKIDGRWTLTKKGAEDKPKAPPAPVTAEMYGTDLVKVGRATVTAEWEIDEDGLYCETYFDQRYNDDFEFIAKAEKVVVSFIEKKTGLKLSVTGGTGSRSYRTTHANVVNQ
jgi:hypothetical protein